MKSLDLEKVIILLSLLLLPAAGYWVYYLNGRIEKGQAALARETAQPEGTIVEIHTLQQQITNTKRNLERASVGDPRVYFSQQITDAQKGVPTLSQEDFAIQVATDGSHFAKNTRKVIAQDEAATIRFGRGEDSRVNRSTINAIIFNAESQSPIWKLRKLKIVNKEFGGGGGRTASAPKLEMPDVWEILDMKFVRRKPASAN